MPSTLRNNIHILFAEDTGGTFWITVWNSESMSFIADEAIEGHLSLRAKIKKYLMIISEREWHVVVFLHVQIIRNVGDYLVVT